MGKRGEKEKNVNEDEVESEHVLASHLIDEPGIYGRNVSTTVAIEVGLFDDDMYGFVETTLTFVRYTFEDFNIREVNVEVMTWRERFHDLSRFVVSAVRRVNCTIGAGERVHHCCALQTGFNLRYGAAMLGDSFQQRATRLTDVAHVARFAGDFIHDVLHTASVDFSDSLSRFGDELAEFAEGPERQLQAERVLGDPL